MIRAAELADIPALSQIENRCFDSDRLSRRQFRYMLTRGHAATRVYEQEGQIAGYVLVLFSRATSMGRLYSIAVAPEARGRGVAQALVKTAEAAARDRERAYLRLEIRKDNTPSIRLFEGLGYRRFGELSDYYQDHMDAWRFEKTLAPDLDPSLARVPYYEQTLDFTCGPASLMMAMKSQRPQLELDRMLELRLWREATTIFMTSGHGGCGPFGLALAAAHRAFQVEVFVNDPGTHLVDSVRSEQKKAVIRLVQEDMQAQLIELGVPIRLEQLALDDLEQRCNEGWAALVLISSYAIYGEKFPHWVVVTGFDEHFIYVNDPFVDYDEGESLADSINMPIPRQQFERMARYGKAGLRAMVLLNGGL